MHINMMFVLALAQPIKGLVLVAHNLFFQFYLAYHSVVGNIIQKITSVHFMHKGDFGYLTLFKISIVASLIATAISFLHTVEGW